MTKISFDLQALGKPALDQHRADVGCSTGLDAFPLVMAGEPISEAVFQALGLADIDWHPIALGVGEAENVDARDSAEGRAQEM